MLYIDIFFECHQAILNGILVSRQNQRDKEYHFQDWFGARLTNLQSTLTFNFEQPGRNTYPDFRMIQNPEGYEIKGLEYPGRYKDYDSNSQVPRGYHNGITIFYVFGRYPKNVSSKTYPVHDLVICHGDFLNADHNYVHKNKSFRGFGSYGDILIRDRKMYVAPTPFGLLNGVESQITLILPRDYLVDNRLVSVGEFSRMEVSQMVVGYSFDMQTNIIRPQLLPNPSIGQVHDFIAYRPAILQSINALGQKVSLKSQSEQQEVLNEAEEEEKST
ncbi:hypothetical protein [Nostoc sp. JL33]|uniref:hypothetical protein n=1 Tax=Nostoc sp. JL33 TaxID=2815396 RepID=UPI0025FBE21A|nr:hypothetical protein [Nostoc sp. JL33]MBN3873367.1 hypothetical protein [Nostoc sp. JL33]